MMRTRVGRGTRVGCEAGADAGAGAGWETRADMGTETERERA